MSARQRFTGRSKNLQQNKIVRTAQLRIDEASAEDIQSLPVGQVVQVFSLYCQVNHDGKDYLCVTRKTMSKLAATQIVVGDLVRFRLGVPANMEAEAEGIVEDILPRKTLVTRAQSFKGHQQQPIVANADQMVMVASVREPRIKWGLIDRMLVAALAGGLRGVICLNKFDLVDPADPEAQRAVEILDYYSSIGIESLRTSTKTGHGLDALRVVLRNRVTVLAGHSGVGKSSLAGIIEPGLDLRVAELSNYTGKGRHTTTSARMYKLGIGGFLIDTPGVKQFGLWNITRENLADYYSDVTGGTAPPWRVESYQQILESLTE